jgi:hypothetical protein
MGKGVTAMKTLFAAGVLAALAVPAFADEIAAETPRLSELEKMIVTSIKDEPATVPSTTAERLQEIETWTITAIKEQPKEHEVDSKTAALLAALENE